MKAISQYIVEKISSLKNKEKGIIVFDIDDTLVKTDGSVIHVYKKEPGKEEIALTTAEYAKDPDALDKSKRSWFSYRDFHDPMKAYASIVNGTPIISNLRIMDDYINAGYEFCFLTARSCEETIKRALSDFLRIKTKNGQLEELGDIFNKTLSSAVNDKYKHYEGDTDGEKKANVLSELCDKYDKVVFVDDDEKNIQAAKNLNRNNLKIIKAYEKQINEQHSDEWLKNILDIKYDFSQYVSMPLRSKSDKYHKGKLQEEIAIKAISEAFPDLQVVSCAEWCELNGMKYSTKNDMLYGDFMIMQNGKTLYNIDLKVGTKDYIGTPDAHSLANFGSETNTASGEFIYLCLNENGKDKAIITKDVLYEHMKNGDAKFKTSYNRTKLLNPNPFEKATPVKSSVKSDLYEEDFVSFLDVKKWKTL